MAAGKSVLLVDDDENDIALFLLAMAGLGLNDQVATARDGIEALQYLSCQPGRTLPKLLVIDYKMPRMDGVLLLEKLQESAVFKNIPKVMLTSSRASEDVARAYAAGVNAYLLKPVNFTRFNRDVKILMTFWLDLNLVPLKE